MGNKVSSNAVPSRYQFDPRPWTLIGQGQNYRILRNTSNGDQLEQYLHTATDNREFDNLRAMFEYRLDKDYLVASKYFRQDQRREMCSTFFQGSLYTERIPLRMNQIKDLPFPDTLHFVNACLRGFRQLFSKTGGFEINDHMIGINSEAKVKVWMNQDFGADRPIDSGKKDERLMTCQILEIIDKNIDKRTQPQSITHALSRNGPPSFDEAIALLNQYTIRNVISIPSYLVSIAELRDKGYFKKMPSRSTLLGSVRSPLEPSINRSLAFNNSIMSSGNHNSILALPNQQVSNIGISNTILPTPKSVTFSNPIHTVNHIHQIDQPAILSPLNIPLSSPASRQIQLPINYQGVPPPVIGHLQYQGVQPITMLANKYPPPSDYSPLAQPPAHIRSHRTQVRSFMSPPISRERSVERVIQRNISPSPVRPGTPVFGNSQQIQIPTPSPFVNNTSASINIISHEPSSYSSLQINELTQKYLSKSPSSTQLNTPIRIKTQPSQLSQYYQSQKTYQNTNNLPIIVIPNKIQLTVTKITNREPQGVAVENFMLNPNLDNVHSGLIKQILSHTIGLQNALKEGAFHNPTIEGRRVIQQIRMNESKDFSRATTANFTQYSSPSFKDRNGHTDPDLLQRAVKGLANIIDHQKPSTSRSELDFEFNNRINNNYESNQPYLFESFNNNNNNVMVSGFQSVYSVNTQDKSSPQIMALVNQALNTTSNISIKKDNLRNFYKMSQISQIQSVDYDSRPGSYVRS